METVDELLERAEGHLRDLDVIRLALKQQHNYVITIDVAGLRPTAEWQTVSRTPSLRYNGTTYAVIHNGSFYVSTDRASCTVRTAIDEDLRVMRDQCVELIALNGWLPGVRLPHSEKGFIE